MTVVAWVWIAIAAVTFLALLKVNAPYGRHARKGWGPMLPAWLGWIVMELPSPVLIAGFWIASPYRSDPASVALMAAWVGHYVYRTFVFPFLGSGKKAPMPASIAASAFCFNLVNGSLNGYGLFHVDGPREIGARFFVGMALFLAGFAIHVKSDAILRALRKPGESGYRIPQGFLFRWVSCPNYLGEVVEWIGFAVAAGTLWPASFAAWTVANLVPRAFAHHRWYRETFEDYPRGRRAIV